jgi:hypothetical protein
MRALVLTLGALLVLGCGDSSSSTSSGAGGENSGAGGANAGGAGGASSSSGEGAATSSSGGQSSGGSGLGGSGPNFDAQGLSLCDVINQYRVSQGLAEVPVSVALMTVAEAHVADLSAHPEIASGNCNLHSWSELGSWSGCCYTPDHAQAQCMWSKPAELTSTWGPNQYSGNGYEIAASGAGTPESALALWQSSPGHHEVILNAGTWQPYNPWPAMGCGMKDSYAVVWFGDATDPQTL